MARSRSTATARFSSPGFAVHAVDTTGAGDVFRGGFIYGRLSGWPIERMLRFANAAAAVSCTRLGALSGVPSPADVEAMLAGAASRGSGGSRWCTCAPCS